LKIASCQGSNENRLTTCIGDFLCKFEEIGFVLVERDT
jgi:hypothetical protein